MTDTFVDALRLGGLVAAAVYLLATGRRCRRAMWVGLAGAGLLLANMLVVVAAGSWVDLIVWLGAADRPTARRPGMWAAGVVFAAGKGLLVVAVLVGRPPAADRADD